MEEIKKELAVFEKYTRRIEVDQECGVHGLQETFNALITHCS